MRVILRLIRKKKHISQSYITEDEQYDSLYYIELYLLYYTKDYKLV